MKYCNKCESFKDFSEFNKNSRKSDGLQSQCRDCTKAHNRRTYLTNEKRRESIKADRDKLKTWNKTLLERYKRLKGCKYCKVEFTPVALDLHHPDPTEKEGNVSRLICVSTKRLKSEIRKCEVVCSNCHRKLHAGILG